MFLSMNLPVSLCMEATLSCEVNDCIDSVQHNKNVERTVLVWKTIASHSKTISFDLATRWA